MQHVTRQNYHDSLQVRTVTEGRRAPRPSATCARAAAAANSSSGPCERGTDQTLDRPA